MSDIEIKLSILQMLEVRGLSDGRLLEQATSIFNWVRGIAPVSPPDSPDTN
jgi:hypothetical protein